MQSKSKPVEFHGTTLEDMRKFPDEARKEMGHQIQLVQYGHNPNKYRDMGIVGPGAREIKIQSEDGIFRTIYVAKFEEAVHILHAFQKKTQQTAKSDIDLAKKRYKELIRGRKK
jgi:phage-related protein